MGRWAARSGVGLADLARSVRKLGRLRPRRLDRRCAVTAGLAPDGTLRAVAGQPNKLEEAVQQRWRVVLATPRPDDELVSDRPSTALLREASARYAADLPAAVADPHAAEHRIRGRGHRRDVGGFGCRRRWCGRCPRGKKR